MGHSRAGATRAYWQPAARFKLKPEDATKAKSPPAVLALGGGGFSLKRPSPLMRSLLVSLGGACRGGGSEVQCRARICAGSVKDMEE